MRLLPVNYDKNGKVIHILLTATMLDSNSYNEVYSIDYNRRSLAALFGNIPCAIVMYEWSNYELQVIHSSNYYDEQFGHSFVKAGADNKYHQSDDFIHPDDLKEYQDALSRAILETHEFHHEYRVWDDKRGGYIWERADVTISAERNNSRLIYAVYSDITKLKEQELSLEKTYTSLIAALNASNQLCYEYDPVLHTEVCLTDENFFNFPRCITNYPESLKGGDMLHPDDVDKFIETVHLMDSGCDFAQCESRMKKDGEYIWYSCSFHKHYDLEKERNIAILTVVDISPRMEMKRMYEDRLQSLLAVRENTLCMSILNLTQNTYELVECVDSVKQYVNTTLPLREYLVFAADAIVGEEDKEKFRKLFTIENLIEQAEEGNTHLEIEYLLKASEEHYEWINSGINLINNPLTGEVTGAVYSKSIQSEKMNRALLGKTLEHDYLFAAMVFVDTDEFYLYNPMKSRFYESRKHYWDVALLDADGHCSDEVKRELDEIFVKEKILAYLEEHSEFVYTYDGIMNGQTIRLEIRFSYADDTRTTLLASMRNVTDTALLAKYRHDSEHDLLTGLYNRKTVFNKAKELLDAHPDEQFVVIHLDMKHFKMYNTFFGEDAGDRLLCDIADQLRWMDKDFDYWVYGRINADVFCAFLPYDESLHRKHVTVLKRYWESYRLDYLTEPKVGVYFVKDRSLSMEAMFTRATMAAKTIHADFRYDRGVFSDDMERALAEDQMILAEMQGALENDQFKVYLQPKYSLRSNKPVGAEALVRWEHPNKGLVPPGRFIPLFESNGYIAKLDRYVWEQTCQLLRRWKSTGRPMLPISVNVSRISAYSQDTVRFLKELVRKYDIEPKYLELELTESAYVESPKEISLRLAELREYGFKILMDDFGSGYSSLNTLKDLPIDILKLDMRFLSGDDDGRGTKILSSIIRMSKLLQLPVIAEGVETENQAGYLRSIGCEYVQGYLYAHPMPVREYEDTVLDKVDAACVTDKITAPTVSGEKILLDDSGISRLVDDMATSPVILLEYHDSEIHLIRTNKSFLREFDMQDDLRPASLIMRERIPEGDHAHMLQAFHRCAETKKSISFRIRWNGDEGVERQYLANAIYRGHIGIEKVFAVTFINENPADYFE